MSQPPLRIAIAGASGRMGRALCTAIADAPDLALVGATDAPGGANLGESIHGVAIMANPAVAAAAADVFIDFTTPAATLAALAALPSPVALIIGTTGFTPDQDAAIAAAAGERTIVKSGNFSLGVNVLAALVRQAASRLGPDWDIEILEAHHRAKIDAPSGTALLLGDAAAAGRGAALADVRLTDRLGARPEGGIGFASLRGGGVIGEHEVIFAAQDELIRFSHQALDRTLFAKGALAAARWAHDRPAGLYSMADVLGL